MTTKIAAAPKFTPGPLRVEKIGGGLHVLTKSGHVVASISEVLAYKKAHAANANAIAAVPELYTALAELLAEADTRAENERVPMGNGPDYFPRRADSPGEEMARAALAKVQA